jgi:hypothetical protein
MKTTVKIFLNTVLWGCVLWLFGYILSILLFSFVPKDFLGWIIMPFGILAAIWVLVKKIERETFQHYVAIGIIWTIIAFVFDYIFLVNFLNLTDYYKTDVYLYYTLTFLIPIVVGWYKIRK